MAERMPVSSETTSVGHDLGGLKMIVVHAYVDIGEDRMLRLRVPDNVPVGSVEVVVALEPRRTRSPEERRAAVDAGYGALKDVPGSTEEFLAERREDDRRRDRALREAAGEPPDEDG